MVESSSLRLWFRILDLDNLQVKAFQVSNLKGASISYAAPDVLFAFINRVKVKPNIVKGGDVYAISMTIFGDDETQ